MGNGESNSEAQDALKFYQTNYSWEILNNIDNADKRLLFGKKPLKCRFCNGEPPLRTFKREAHVISELLGNKSLFSLYECDECNARFGKFEDDLGKMSLFGRSIGGVVGKKGIPTIGLLSHGRGNRPKMALRGNSLDLSHDAGDIGVVVDENAKTVKLKYNLQPYRPLGAYKALCKSAYSLLPNDELNHFDDLRKWLMKDDLTTDMVYSEGWYICYSTFVPAWRPFGQSVAVLLRRKSEIRAPYLSFFIATGNVSYQIFLPCPIKDGSLIDTKFKTFAFPHIFHLQPELTDVPLSAEIIDLSSAELLRPDTRTVSFSYENKIRIE